MKKLIALILAMVMVFGLVACGGETAPETTGAPAGTEGGEMTPAEKAAAEAEIRFAIGLLLDRNYIVESVSQAGEKPANSFVADGMADVNGGNFAVNANGGKGYYSVDPEAFEDNFAQAIEILKKYYEYDEETGKFTNVPTLAYIYNTSDAHKAIAEYLQGALSGMGITVNLENQEWNFILN